MKFARIFDRINDFLVGIAGGLLAAVMVVVCVDASLRYLVRHAEVWVVPVGAFTLFFVTFLSTAWLLQRDGHVKVELLLGRLKPRAQASINIITSIISALVLLIVAWYGLGITWDFYQEGVFELSMLNIPKAPLMVVIPVGSILLLIQFLRRARGYLGNLRTSPDNKE